MTIPITATPGDGAVAADYSGVPANVTIDAGQTSKTFTFTAADDTDDDDGETVALGFEMLPTGVTAGTTSTTTVTITDNDEPPPPQVTPVTVSFGAASYTVAEGSTVSVEVKLDQDPERTVVIPITATPGDGAETADYSGVPANVTFDAGETSKTFTFAATDDAADDDGETVALGFGTRPTGVTAGTTSTTTVNITDDDDPAVTVSFGAASYTVAEGSTVSVEVKLDQDPERTVTIPITATPGGGAVAADYSGVPANVTFASGDTSKTFTFTATDDTADDDGETVALGFGTRPSGVTAGTPSTTTVNITDDDVPAVTVMFGASAYTAAEGGQVEVTVTLSADPERTVVVPIEEMLEDGATSGDYSGVPSSVTFASGETSQTITFMATADADNDDGEGVQLSFGAPLPAGVTEGTPNETTVSITDDDVPAVTVMFGASAYTAAEGGQVEVTVTLSADPERAVVVPIEATPEGGATSGDYSGVPSSVTFQSGGTSQTITFMATADADNDDGEGVQLSFGAPLPAGVTEGTPSETTVTITDDDVPAVTVMFGASGYTAAEGGQVEVTVTLSADPERTVVVPIEATLEGGATSGDYSGVSSSVTFQSGDTSQTITFMATADTDNDDGEGVQLSFGAPLPAGVTAGTPNETTVSITDDDDPAVTVSFGAASYTVTEGSTVSVEVELDLDPERTVTIPITATPGNGAEAADYSGVPANVTFDAGQTSKTFTFAATDDSADDDGETVALGFETPPTGVTAGTPSATTVSITDDDDPAVTVMFGASAYTAAEGGQVEVTVTLSADPERTVVVPIVATLEGGASSADYSGVPSNVTFASGDTSQTITFMATADADNDDGEGVKLSFGTPLPAGVTAGTPSATTVSITDDDVPAVTVMFGASAYTAAEGGQVEVTVTLSADPERTVVVPIVETLEGGATSGDYSGVSSSVTFASGETSQTITFMATADTDNDDGEGVKLSFGAPLPAGVTAGTPNETTVSITDDDVPAVISAPVPGGGGATGPTPSVVDFEWTVKRDLEALESGHDTPSGMWSNGATIWILENGAGADDAVYAYDLSSGERVEGGEFVLAAENRAPRGMWSNGQTVWVSDSGRERLYAYGLEGGEREEGREFDLAERNRDARGIWSDGETMWVLDNRGDALFAYNLATGQLRGEYSLASRNGDPRGVWSDGVTIWVADHGLKELWAYRLPTRPDAPVVEDAGPLALERVDEEDFTHLSGSSNNSPRGIWSDGDSMYVADASDTRVYSYNTPDTIDARLASLGLSGVDIGEFDPRTRAYRGIVEDGVTQTTVEAEPAQSRATVLIEPADADVAAEGHQMVLDGVDEITVTVTSPDGSRERIYRVRMEKTEAGPSASCLRGSVTAGFSLVVFEGGSLDDLVTCAEGRDIVAVYALHDGTYVSYILEAPDFVNRGFRELFHDGLSSMTPLIVGSNGPPTADPFGDDPDDNRRQPWPECLHGAVANSLSLVVYEGGSVEDMVACAQSLSVTAVYALAEGEWASYILGAPESVNRRFFELFPEGLPSFTPLVAKSEETPGASADDN